jgi:hypothetical protein
MERLMNRWIHVDRDAATSWMRQADLDSELSPMIDPFIRGLAATHPDEASSWIERVSDPQRRVRLILMVASAWRKHDPAGAEAWLETLDLSEEVRLKIARKRPELATGQRLVIPEEKTP